MSGEQQEKSEAAAAATTVQSSILDQVIKATRPQDQADADRVKDYFKQFLDRVIQPGQVVSKDVEKNIKHWISQIDQKLSTQLDEVMHNPAYQKLEGTWRGLKYLVNMASWAASLMAC